MSRGPEYRILKITTNSQLNIWKRFVITSHKGNRNQSHSEIPLHASQDDLWKRQRVTNPGEDVKWKLWFTVDGHIS